MANKYLDLAGLQRLVNKIKELIPTRTSELDNDNGFITIEDIPDSTWENIQNKPDTFTPSEHNHTIGDITGLQNELNSKETPSGAQAKANQAEQNAKNYTDSELVAHAKNATLNQLGHVNHAVLTATLNTSWSGSSAPYTKTISVSGILSTDVPFIDIVMSGTYATDTAREEAWGYIYRAVTADNAITFYATDKPTVSLPLQIKVVR